MDLSLESLIPGEGGLPPARQAGRSLEDWNAAYTRVESYFGALGIRNRVLRASLVIQVLNRARRRAEAEPHRSTTELAAEEMDQVVTAWYGQVLQESPAGAENRLSTRGRLALLLADMPGQWQEQFLRPGPWPERFVSRMREVYLRAGPDFQLSKMAPRPIHFGPITTFANFSRLPYARMVSIWLLFALLLTTVFWLTHRVF
jgi:hypothetical protein